MCIVLDKLSAMPILHLHGPHPVSSLIFSDTLMFRVFYWVFMLSLSINFRLLNGSDSVCTCCLGGAGLAKVGYKNKYYYG